MRASETSTNRMRLTIISTHSVGREARVLAEQHAHSMPSVLELALACQRPQRAGLRVSGCAAARLGEPRNTWNLRFAVEAQVRVLQHKRSSKRSTNLSLC
jgi:hypothetical protein